MVKYDNILQHLGEFGRCQKRVCFYLCFISIFLALHAFSTVFLAAETEHWCYVPELDSYFETYCMGQDYNDGCLETIKNFSIPFEEISGACGDTLVYSACYRYNITINGNYSSEHVMEYTNTTVQCDHGWKYDRTQYKSTVFQEFDLVCDRYYLGALSTSMYMVGLLVGSYLFGILSDKIGRLPAFVTAFISLSIIGSACAFSPNIVVFCIFRFANGAVASGILIAGLVLVIEHVGQSKRIFAGMMLQYSFAIGYMLLAGIAYFVRYWWLLQLIISLPCVLFLSYYWIIPESPRWLISTGRVKKAEKVIRLIEKENSVHLPNEISEIMKEKGKLKENLENKGTEVTVLDIFRSPTMTKTSINLFFAMWFTITLVYYDLSLNTSNLGGNDYVNAFISAAVEIPAYTISLYLPNTVLGRCGMQSIGISIAMLGKCAITVAFSIIGVFAAELYPTAVRNVGTGLCWMCGRIGGILAPQMLLMRTIWAPLPLIVFGTTPILSGLLVLLLPETRGLKNLPDTIKEAEKTGRKIAETEEVEDKKTDQVELQAN
ncbi:organic cation transporter protein-like [Ptychodera flava]|uniref:organic cation transporter protein-like n=1 Tax=Ptychodera flava TaxID=63121 RepID=UPI003969E03B